MALVKGTNSYVTEAEADAYFEDRTVDATWLASSGALRDQALVTAWLVLDNLAYYGYTSDPDQPMAWPREITVSNEVVNRRTGRFATTSANDFAAGEFAPIEIKKAQYELAFHYIQNPTALGQASTVENLEVGSIKLENITPVDILPGYVKKFLEPWYSPSNANQWFRSN